MIRTALRGAAVFPAGKAGAAALPFDGYPVASENMRTSPSIEWQPWGEEAFSQAATTQRPILLRIGATWCAWCRAMWLEADVDPVVLSSISQNFVPIYVDADRRPDINERYNLGGWPTNAFLTPRGDLITGGTYFDTDTFRVLLNRVAQSWQERRAEVEEAVGSARRDAEQRRKPKTGPVLSADEQVERVVGLTIDSFDFRFGGFGRDSKFPHTASIELLLTEFRRTAESRLRDAALMSLEAMCDRSNGRGALADADGGFFRYCGTRDWSEPRFERLLADQARLVSCYLMAFQLTAEPRWAASARGLVDYMRGTLFDPRRHVFHGSQGGVGGDEYFCFEPPNRPASAAPAVDRGAYVSSNALTASALIHAGCVLKDDAALESGVGLVDALARRGRLGSDETLLGHGLDGTGPSGPILLSSQVYTARALVDAYEAVGGTQRLAAAALILDEVHNRLRDALRQAYTDTIIEPGAEGYLSQPLFPVAENAAVADTLLRLSVLMDAPALESRAMALLAALTPTSDEHELVAAPIALALQRTLVRERVVIHLAGVTSIAAALPIVRAAHTLFVPFKHVKFVDPERDRTRARAMAAATANGPAAMVCRGAACAEPTSDPERLIAIIARAAATPGT